MADRELLKLAAKAAGEYYGEWSDRAGAFRIRYAGEWREWNPLTDDGDALRLAVKLGIGFWVDSFVACCSWYTEGENPFTEGMAQLAEEIVNDDPYAATRRAIVRAAAEIGRGMP